MARIEGLVSSDSIFGDGVATSKSSSSLWSNVGSCNIWTLETFWFDFASGKLFEVLLLGSIAVLELESANCFWWMPCKSPAKLTNARLICLTCSCSWLWFTERLLTMYFTKWLAVLDSLIQRLKAYWVDHLWSTTPFLKKTWCHHRWKVFNFLNKHNKTIGILESLGNTLKKGLLDLSAWKTSPNTRWSKPSSWASTGDFVYLEDHPNTCQWSVSPPVYLQCKP